jgi:hypothetical protein
LFSTLDIRYRLQILIEKRLIELLQTHEATSNVPRAYN